MQAALDLSAPAPSAWRQSIFSRRFHNRRIEEMYRQYLFFNGQAKSSRRLALFIALSFCSIAIFQMTPNVGTQLEDRYSGLLPSPFECPELEAASSVAVVLYSIIVSGLMYSRLFQPRTYVLFCFLGSTGLVSSYSWSLFVGFAAGLPLRTKSLMFANATTPPTSSILIGAAAALHEKIVIAIVRRVVTHCAVVTLTYLSICVLSPEPLTAVALSLPMGALFLLRAHVTWAADADGLPFNEVLLFHLVVFLFALAISYTLTNHSRRQFLMRLSLQQSSDARIQALAQQNIELDTLVAEQARRAMQPMKIQIVDLEPNGQAGRTGREGGGGGGRVQLRAEARERRKRGGSAGNGPAASTTATATATPATAATATTTEALFCSIGSVERLAARSEAAADARAEIDEITISLAEELQGVASSHSVSTSSYSGVSSGGVSSGGGGSASRNNHLVSGSRSGREVHWEDREHSPVRAADGSLLRPMPMLATGAASPSPASSLRPGGVGFRMLSTHQERLANEEALGGGILVNEVLDV